MQPSQSKLALFNVVLALILFLASQNTLSAQGVGTSYVGVSGGAISFNANEIRDHDLDFDSGFVVAGILGYIFGSVRAEGEVSYSQSDLQFGANKEELTVLRGTGGLYLDFVDFSDANILPFVGGGFGIASLEFDDEIDDSDIALTAHGELGVSFAAASSFDVVFSYRFQHFETNIDHAKEEFQSHQIRVGIRSF